MAIFLYTGTENRLTAVQEKYYPSTIGPLMGNDREGEMSAVHAEVAKRMVEQYGYERAHSLNDEQAENSSWGTFTHAFAVAVRKELNRIAEEA